MDLESLIVKFFPVKELRNAINEKDRQIDGLGRANSQHLEDIARLSYELAECRKALNFAVAGHDKALEIVSNCVDDSSVLVDKLLHRIGVTGETRTAVQGQSPSPVNLGRRPWAQVQATMEASDREREEKWKKIIEQVESKDSVTEEPTEKPVILSTGQAT